MCPKSDGFLGAGRTILDVLSTFGGRLSIESIRQSVLPRGRVDNPFDGMVQGF